MTTMSNWLRELRFRALMVSVSVGGVAIAVFVTLAVLTIPTSPDTGGGGLLGNLPGLGGVIER